MKDFDERAVRDWELDEDYYRENGEASELKLEDFMDEDEGGTAGPSVHEKSGDEIRLERTVKDVRGVLALAQEGKTVKEIAQTLGLEPQYVYDIQVTAQGFREDDEIAVAHMMCM